MEEIWREGWGGVNKTEASERLREGAESVLELWDWRQIRELSLEGGRQRRESRDGQLCSRLTPGLPSTPRLRRAGLVPGKIWVSGLPRHCPNWLGQQ